MTTVSVDCIARRPSRSRSRAEVVRPPHRSNRPTSSAGDAAAALTAGAAGAAPDVVVDATVDDVLDGVTAAGTSCRGQHRRETAACRPRGRSLLARQPSLPTPTTRRRWSCRHCSVGPGRGCSGISTGPSMPTAPRLTCIPENLSPGERSRITSTHIAVTRLGRRQPHGCRAGVPVVDRWDLLGTREGQGERRRQLGSRPGTWMDDHERSDDERDADRCNGPLHVSLPGGPPRTSLRPWRPPLHGTPGDGARQAIPRTCVPGGRVTTGGSWRSLASRRASRPPTRCCGHRPPAPGRGDRLLGRRDGRQPERSHQRAGVLARHGSAGHHHPGVRPDPIPAPLAWTSCHGGLQCATLTVPIDYDDPSVGTIDLAVVRRPAQIPSRRVASVVVNPGGPGGSGVGMVVSGYGTDGLNDRLDIVGWDPRGTNRSAPLECASGSGAFTALDPSPNDAAAQARLDDAAEAIADDCGAHGGALLAHMDSVHTARDLEQLRLAMGGEPLTYVGYSYGTAIGLSYADRYPTHIRAMVLDGVVQPDQDLSQMLLGQTVAFDQQMQRTLDDCDHDRSCPVQGASATYDRVMAPRRALAPADLRRPLARSERPGHRSHRVDLRPVVDRPVPRRPRRCGRRRRLEHDGAGRRVPRQRGLLGLRRRPLRRLAPPGGRGELEAVRGRAGRPVPEVRGGHRQRGAALRVLAGAGRRSNRTRSRPRDRRRSW